MLMDKDPNAIKKSLEFMSTGPLKAATVDRRPIVEERCTEGETDVNRIRRD